MQYNQAPQDRDNATYRWAFHLISNDPNRQILYGYSKKEGKREAADKQYLLISTLGRLLGPTNRYLIDKAWHMEIFRRQPAAVGFVEDKIADLYQDGYVLFGDTNLDLPLISFLERYYNAVKSGTFEQLVPVPKANAARQEAEDFTFQNNAYTNRQTLVDHCRAMLHRYPRERVTAYWRAYCGKYHNEWLTAYQTEAPTYANETATPPPVAQATEKAMQRLHAKFGSVRQP